MIPLYIYFYQVKNITVSIYFLKIISSFYLCFKFHHHIYIATRKAIDLETHWKPGNVRPAARYSSNDKRSDAEFTKLLNEFPIPEDYNTAHSVSITEDKKAKSKNIKKL